MPLSICHCIELIAPLSLLVFLVVLLGFATLVLIPSAPLPCTLLGFVLLPSSLLDLHAFLFFDECILSPPVPIDLMAPEKGAKKPQCHDYQGDGTGDV